MTRTNASEKLRELREEADRIGIPAWAEKLERDTLARGGYSDIAHEATSTGRAALRARKAGAHRIAACQPLLVKAREEMERALDAKRRVAAREASVVRAGSAYSEAATLAKLMRDLRQAAKEPAKGIGWPEWLHRLDDVRLACEVALALFFRTALEDGAPSTAPC